MGKAWKFGDNVDTDAIIPGKYLVISDGDELAKHIFENVRGDLREKIKRGDFIVAGRNFGCGSSREHAPLALKHAGVEAVIAKSYARIFFRNAINIGLTVVECDDADRIDDGDELIIYYDKGLIINLTKNESYRIKEFPEFLKEIIRCGGLIEFGKKIYKGSNSR